ncbi:MAG: HDIG domain-containing metalloprotein [Desulfobulbus sp.]|jgi:uncharacterized protein
METAGLHLPSLSDCVELFDHYGMLVNIRHHSLVVARLAECLHRGLSDFAPDQPQPDYRLVITGALLHDIAKTPCLGRNCNHAQLGGEICREHGYPEIAEIVEQHVRIRNFDPDRYQAGRFNAAELVYYADKRVRHNVVVNLNERREYILDHYGKGLPDRCLLIHQNFQQCIALEEYLFRWLPFSTEDLGRF